MYSRTSSDTLKLRRLITSLKETGSELGGQLEDQSNSYITGVQIVKSNNRNTVRFDSDDEEGDNEFNIHAENIRKERSKAGKVDQPQCGVKIDCWEEENRRLEQMKKDRLRQAREEEEAQKQRLREAEEIRKRQREEREAAERLRKEQEHARREKDRRQREK